MKKLLALAAILLGAVTLHAGEYPDISIAELKTAIAEKKVALIDANGTNSYQSGHIPGAINFETDKAKLASELPADKGALVVAYCANPSCSAYAAGRQGRQGNLGYYQHQAPLGRALPAGKDAGAPLEK